MFGKINDDIADVVEQVQRSLVTVQSGRRGQGSGVIVHPDCLMLTNAHVIHRRRQLNVTLPDGETLPARLLARSQTYDLAVLRADASDLPALSFADGEDIRPGQLVLAVGNPWGVRGAVSFGNLIAAGDQLLENGRAHHDLIAASLWLRPGHSGGPLVDTSGRLLGINTMMAGPQVGVAIPVWEVKEFLSRVDLQQRSTDEAVAVA